MSWGLVVCSYCKREVHQDGPRNHSKLCQCPGNTGFCLATWTHCEDGKPICDDSSAIYPKDSMDIRGKVCRRDEI